MIDAPIYIYTVPKAGTYFLAGLLEELEYINTGWHISTDSYLDTQNVDDVVNREFPSKATVNQFYLKTFCQILPRHFAFGHFSPGQLPDFIAKRFFFISSYRHPREVLQSEFIDFRYRRKDIIFISKSEIVNPKTAFEIYLEKHGFIIKNIFTEFLLFQERYQKKIYRDFFGENYIILDFKKLISDSIYKHLLEKLATYFERSPEDITMIIERAKMRDNKTKSIGLQLPISRDELWTKTAEKIYKNINFQEVEIAISNLEKTLN